MHCSPSATPILGAYPRDPHFDGAHGEPSRTAIEPFENRLPASMAHSRTIADPRKPVGPTTNSTPNNARSVGMVVA
jgi:hypothetical protein